MTHGLSFGLAYTWSKAMTAWTNNCCRTIYFDDDRNYGPRYGLGGPVGAPQVAVFNYVYEVPGLGKKLGSKPLGWITDNWSISGITSLQSYGRLAIPTLTASSFTSTHPVNAPVPNFTGSSTNEAVRLDVVGNPNLNAGTWNFYNTVNWAAFAPPKGCNASYQSLACFGNGGAGQIIKIPTRVNNWDMTFAKSFKLAEKRQISFRAEMYNIFNHTQFSALNSNVQYSAPSYYAWMAGTGPLVQSNSQLGRPTAARSPRQMSMSLRLTF